jgi:predicted NBD/HSP70 family sugar kinase
MVSNMLAFDVGGSRLKAGVVSLADGTVSGHLVSDVHGATATAVLDQMRHIGRGLLSQFDCSTSGACLPGLVDQSGTVLSLPGKLDGIVGIPLREWFATTFGLDAVVTNDAAAYGLGEARFGAGAGFGRVVTMTIGTGVGVGVVEDGALVSRGPFGGGILGGHIPIAESAVGYLDSNGRPGTIEALCCAQRIVDYASEDGSDASTVEEVVRDAISGIQPALRALDRFRDHLVRAIVALAHAHAPDVVVLGGGVMEGAAPFVDRAESEVNDRLFGSFSTRVCRARLGDTAGLSGLAACSRADRAP